MKGWQLAGRGIGGSRRLPPASGHQASSCCALRSPRGSRSTPAGLERWEAPHITVRPCVKMMTPANLHSRPTLSFKLNSMFFKIFLMQTIFKVFTELVTMLLLFHVLIFWGPRGMWDLRSLIRNRTHSPQTLEGEVLTTGPPGKSPEFCFQSHSASAFS